ncbi:MAG: VWA domain-containing protein [Nitrospinaceae bacterium]|nr:VWA domain-containing protein [Nitrospinaceae bacterium]NIR57825.1 VWA domain-containing protein [Nitrospinaceae bacterium]NIS88288.1 VWA domain-containing protein [Nitrospinaceae bacterium]NIT85165.1 VWA domain-containing protein [Nitrospinaceae bacterium]NIU47319.1 VWA domain-containing protein [Nitrospinaceae bacterium]
MSYFQFQNPWLFLLLVLIPLIIYAALKNRPAALHYSSLKTLKTVRRRQVDWLAAIPLILRCLAVAFLVVALARPQQGRKSTEILSAGVDIILAIDTSGSMQAQDFEKKHQPVDRLTVVKDVVSEFIDSREYDRIGMVVFGNEAFTQCPLTLDHDILHAFVDKLQIGVAGDSTAIGSAIGISAKRLKDLKSKSKVIILLTDGRNNAGHLTPLQAAEIADTLGIKIYTVGVGTRGKAPFASNSILGPQMTYQQVEMDEDTLKKIAQKTGGQYFRATDTDSLKKIYAQIDSLEKSEVKWIDHSEYKELFPAFALPALVLILSEKILTHTRLRRLP